MKRISLAISMMGIVLGAAACQSTPEEPVTGPAIPAQAQEAVDDTPALSPTMLSFAPGDLSSSTSSTPITLFVDSGAQGADADLLEKLVEQIELRTYPELEPVDFDVRVMPAARPSRPVRSGDGKTSAATEPLRDNPGRASIVLLPRRPLASRWHVVSLAALPAGTRPVAWNGVEAPALGAFAARFHPGSAPVLREVRLCEKQDGRAARVIAAFSEGLRVEPSRAAKLARAQEPGSGEACTVVTPVAADVPQSMLEIDCPASVLKSRNVDLGLDGLVSRRGAPLSSIEARGRAVDFNDTLDFSEADAASGCRTITIQ
jgi:hypothetical protein